MNKFSKHIYYESGESDVIIYKKNNCSVCKYTIKEAYVANIHPNPILGNKIGFFRKFVIFTVILKISQYIV